MHQLTSIEEPTRVFYFLGREILIEKNMTDVERMIAVCNFDRWHRELDHPDYDHACEHRPWEKNAYVAGYDKAKREMEDIINRAYRRSKDGYLITIAEIIGVVIQETKEEKEIRLRKIMIDHTKDLR